MTKVKGQNSRNTTDKRALFLYFNVCLSVTNTSSFTPLILLTNIENFKTDPTKKRDIIRVFRKGMQSCSTCFTHRFTVKRHKAGASSDMEIVHDTSIRK